MRVSALRKVISPMCWVTLLGRVNGHDQLLVSEQFCDVPQFYDDCVVFDVHPEEDEMVLKVRSVWVTQQLQHFNKIENDVPFGEENDGPVYRPDDTEELPFT